MCAHVRVVRHRLVCSREREREREGRLCEYIKDNTIEVILEGVEECLLKKENGHGTGKFAC